MLIDPSTTWLLVSTSPDDVMIMPVPAAAPLVPDVLWMTVLMSTIAGSTLAAIACTLIVPFWFVDGLTGEIGAVELDGAVVCGNVAVWAACEVCRYRAMVSPMPIPPAPARIVAAMVPTASQRPHEGRGARAVGVYVGGISHPSGDGGGAGSCCSCGAGSLDCGFISDIGSTPILLASVVPTTMRSDCLRTIRGSLEFPVRVRG